MGAGHNLATVTNPLSSESFTYDDRGRVATYTDAQNRTTTITYDNIDRITNITYDDLTEKTVNYDCCGITDITDPSGTLYFTHDDANRLTSFTDIHGKTLGYEYDSSGNLIKLTYPDGKSVLYAYDKANRLTSVTDWLAKETSYEYDPGGRLTMTVYPNGVTTIYTYDNADRLVSLLSYDVSGKFITSYDYTYDQLHNRAAGSAYQPLQRSPHPATSAYAYDDENRLLSVNDDSYSYNESGELTGRMVEGSSTTYTWTITGMLNSVSSGTDTYEYAYDPIGNRVSRTYNGVETRYVVDPSSVLLAETDGQGNITAYYVHGLGLISKITPQGDAYYYHYDALGSTVAMTDAAGAVVNKYAYGIFGQVIDEEEQVENHFKYVGAFGVMDEGNGLYFMRARYYDPEVGRFISKDPIGLEGGINMYAYVGGNPINFVDPSGLYGTNDCSYYDKRCEEAGGDYYCDTAPRWCNRFPKYPDPNPSRDDDFEGWFRCTRQCLQDCDRWLSDEDSCLNPDPRTDSFFDPQHTFCHVVCYTGCGADKATHPNIP